MKVDIVNKSAHPNPSYATIGSAGLDLRAFLKDSIILRPFERKVIPTGIYISLPIGYEAQVRPRSGLAVKHGLTVINSPGTIDSDYRGVIAVILANLCNSDFDLKNGGSVCSKCKSNNNSSIFNLKNPINIKKLGNNYESLEILLLLISRFCEYHSGKIFNSVKYLRTT